MYTYSAYLWPSFISTALVACLSWYGWRRRKVAGALPFALGCLFAVAWSVGAILEAAAVDPGTKVLWLKFQVVWQLPVVTAGTLFLIEYAGFDRWLTTRVVSLLAAPSVLLAAFIATNGLHHLAWVGFAFEAGEITPLRGPVITGAFAVSYVLSAFNLGMFGWLFFKFPRHRWPVALMITGQVGARILFEVRMGGGFPGEWDVDPFVLLFLFGLYAVALFGFHVFDPVPAARRAALEQMSEGMIVLDPRDRIVDANRAAERILGETVAGLRGRAAGDALPFLPFPPDEEPEVGILGSEVELKTGGLVRHYAVETTRLRDEHGEVLGHLLLLDDITERKRAQTRLLQQERVVATLEERERLARELHDSIGQVLGYLSLQAQTIRKRLQDGDGEKADAMLARLTEVAQGAHADVRESILALKAASADGWSFLPTIARYLEDFGTQYGIKTDFRVAGETGEAGMDLLEPTTGVQLLRVVQEALTNARRHGKACSVQVTIEMRGDRARVIVEDDGCGFDPALLQPQTGDHFGLTFMRERMAKIGGNLAIDSQPGTGTTVSLDAPLSTTEEVKV